MSVVASKLFDELEGRILLAEKQKGNEQKLTIEEVRAAMNRLAKFDSWTGRVAQLLSNWDEWAVADKELQNLYDGVAATKVASTSIQDFLANAVAGYGKDLTSLKDQIALSLDLSALERKQAEIHNGLNSVRSKIATMLMNLQALRGSAYATLPDDSVVTKMKEDLREAKSGLERKINNLLPSNQGNMIMNLTFTELAEKLSKKGVHVDVGELAVTPEVQTGHDLTSMADNILVEAGDSVENYLATLNYARKTAGAIKTLTSLVSQAFKRDALIGAEGNETWGSPR